MFFKKRAIKRYMSVLPAKLAKDYGGGSYYTIGQILTAIDACGLSKKYRQYAVAMFIDPEDLKQTFEMSFSAYEGMEVRREIADMFFDGEVEFVLRNGRSSQNGNPGTDPFPGGTND